MRIVILRGPDRYLRDAYTRRLVDALEAAHGAVDRFSYDGAEVEPAVVLDELRSYGLLQQHKLVVVDQADRLLAAASDEGAATAGRRTARALFERYAVAPVESATLLLRADTWRPGRLDKAVAAVGAVIRCDAPDGPAAKSWCIGRAQREHGARMTPEAAAMLVDRIGPDLTRLDAEIAKLAAFVGGGEIDADAVRELVGATREEAAWAIQSVLLSGSTAATVAKLRELLVVSGQPEQLVAWAITDLLRKLHGVSRLMRQGGDPASIARVMKLWGPGRDQVLRAARRLAPEAWAALLQHSIDADVRNKTGVGRPDRTLEALAVRIADTMAQ